MLFNCPFCKQNILVHNNVVNCYAHYSEHVDIIQYHFDRNIIFRMDINFQKNINTAIFPPEITGIFNFKLNSLKIHNGYQTINLNSCKQFTDLKCLTLSEIKEYLKTLILFN